MKRIDDVNIRYVNSLGMSCDIAVPLQSKDNLMEIIRDYGYEDWGECRGRAWCRTCHVSTSRVVDDEMMPEEKEALGLIEHTQSSSRLACQMILNSSLDGIEIYYQGDDLQ